MELVFILVSSEKIIENWSLDLTYLSPEDSKTDSEKLDQQLAALMRQIQNSVAFLPVISNELCKFDLLVHCHRDEEVPALWEGATLGTIPFEHITDKLRTTSATVTSSPLLFLPDPLPGR